MKQVVQRYVNGEVELLDVPPPQVEKGHVLVRTLFSAVSPGTERSSLRLGRKSLVGKARSRPEQVARVLDTVRQRGIRETARLVRERLHVPTPLGYSSCGIILDVGEGVHGLARGERVACAGAGHANHAEVVSVPRRLVARVPEGVASADAAFTTIGSIAFWGARRSGAGLGEVVVVVGLGVVGLLTVQLLCAGGSRVVGLDLSRRRAELAVALGAEGGATTVGEAGRVLAALGVERGADAVVVAASSGDARPVITAGRLVRDRGRVVILGRTRVDLPWGPFYEKEIEVLFSRSYGPGRYDPSYEEKGVDYPLGYVRWTEQRNMEEFLRLLQRGCVDLVPLGVRRVNLSDACRAYEELLEDEDSSVPLALLFEYDAAATKPEEEARNEGLERAEPASNGAARGTVARVKERVSGPDEAASPRGVPVAIGFLGAGSFARAELLPALRRCEGARLVRVATRSGLSARDAVLRSRVQECSPDAETLLLDPEVDLVVIATRHDLHADLVLRSLVHGKKVFVEKPLCLREEELAAIEREVRQRDGWVMVGFNRRFAPLLVELREALPPGPKSVQVRVNAGPLGADSWYRDPEVGGGRVQGEIAHFLDLVAFLTSERIVRVYAESVRCPGEPADTVVTSLCLSGGSVASIHYTSLGSGSYSKEMVEVFCGGQAFGVDNFRRAVLSRGAKVRRVKGRGQDKGHRGEMEALVRSSRGSAPAVPFEEAVAATRATFALLRSLVKGQPVEVEGGSLEDIPRRGGH